MIKITRKTPFTHLYQGGNAIVLMMRRTKPFHAQPLIMGEPAFLSGKQAENRLSKIISGATHA